MKKIIMIFTIMLFTASVLFAQWQIDEGFEDGVIPTGWTIHDENEDGESWAAFNNVDYAHGGTWVVYAGDNSYSNDDHEWLVTPEVTIVDGDSFTFWARSWYGTEDFNVKLSVYGTSINGFDFTDITLGTYTGIGNEYVEYSYDLSAYAEQTVCLGIEWIQDTYALVVDDVKLGQDPPAFPAPSYLNATNILATQADFGWTENGSATVWNIEVGIPGFTPGTSTYVQAYTGVTSNPYTGTGLTASTDYEFYVQADYGTRETSNWAGPESFSTTDGSVPLSAGDIAFTALNSEGDDDFAIVTLSDISANSTIYFTDNEPNAWGDSFDDYDEGTLQWDTGSSPIAAGTIVVFTDTDNEGNELFGASIGTLSAASFDGVMAFSTSGDAIYAVVGNPEYYGITAWLAGIQNETGNQGDYFSATGLTFGTTFLNIWESTNTPDGVSYNGDRHQESSFANYLPLLGTYSNWTIENSTGENILPISTEAFSTFSGPDNPATFAAVAVSDSEIDLDWTQNGNSDDVMVAWSSDGTFGTPVNGSTYSAGNSIPGGGTVLYYGSDLYYDHTGLTETTQYYYRAWAYDGSEYSYGVAADATTQCVPYTAPFSENFDSIDGTNMMVDELPVNWSSLEISPSTSGSVTAYASSWCLSAPNIMKMYMVNPTDDLLLITPPLGDLTSKLNQIRFWGRASGWTQDLIIGTMSDPTDETTFTAVQTVNLEVIETVSVWEEYTVVFDDESSYNGTDQYIAFKQGTDYTYRTLYIEDFVYETIPSGSTPIEWGTVTGTVDVGVPSAPGIGYGNGLPNEDLLANPANVGLFFTLTLDDGAAIDVTICLDLATLGYSPFNLAYWINGSWIYEPASGPLSWSGECVTFTLDPTITDRSGKIQVGPSRADVAVPIVFSNEDGPLPYVLSNFSTAIIQNEFVEISWTTQSEVSMNCWNLYRQEPGSDEQIIIYTIPATNTTEPNEYIHNDIYVVNGETYLYYLESVEYDGTSEMYGPVNATMEGEETPDLPDQTELFGNYPNPFNPDTFINFNVKEDEKAKLTIFNTKGQSVMKKTFEPGFYNYTWQADSYPSGVYFYRLETESYTSTNKMLLLK